MFEKHHSTIGSGLHAQTYGLPKFTYVRHDW